MLRRAAAERPPQHPDQLKGSDLALKRWHYSQVVQTRWDLGRELGTMAPSEAADGKSR